MPPEQKHPGPVYQFRVAGYSLEAHIKNQQRRANGLRKQAKILQVKADQIDDDLELLRDSLAEIEAGEQSK